MPSNSDIVLRHRFLQLLNETSQEYLQKPKNEHLWQEHSLKQANLNLQQVDNLINEQKSMLGRIQAINYRAVRANG